MPDQTTTQFLDYLHRGGDFFGYWWSLEGRQSFWWQAGKRTPLPGGRRNVYFGVHPAVAIPTERKDKKTGKPFRPDPKQTRPLIDEIAAVNCVFAEYDAKDFNGDKEAARAKMNSLELRPSVVVDSGGGWHLYWLFEQPWLLGTPEERIKARRLQAAWVRYVESDPQSKDLARVLRVPGTYNHKYNPPRKVEIVEADFTRIYDPAEIAALCAHLMESESLPQSDTGTGGETEIEWARKVLGRAVAMVVSATEGKKHSKLLDAAILAGGVAHLINETEIETTLYNAIKDRASNPANARKTILDGIAYGKQKRLKQEDVSKQTTQQSNSANSGNSANIEWGNMIPFFSIDLPAFPTDIFPPWLRAFVEAEAEATQTPPDLSGMLALAVLSTACARHIVIQAKRGWIEPCNLYAITVLPPASRKSPVFATMTAPLDDYERRLNIDAKDEIAKRTARRDITEQRLTDAKRNAAKAKGNNDILNAMEVVDQLVDELAQLTPPAAPRLIVDDITPEMLSTMLSEQGGRIAALSPEGDIFSIMAGRYSANSTPNIGVFLKGHAGDTLRVDRRGRPSEFVERPAVTLGLTVQPEVLRSLAEKESFRGLGLLGRLLFALPKSMIGTRKIDPDPVPVQIRATYHESIKGILHLAGMLAQSNSANSANSANTYRDRDGTPDASEYSNNANSGNSALEESFNNNNIYILTLTSQSSSLLSQFETWLEPQLLEQTGTLSHIADWAGKLVGAVVRVSALLHVAETYPQVPHDIQTETVARAIGFAQYLIPHARAAFAEIGADPAVNNARLVLSWIEKTSVTTFSKRDAFEGVKGRFKRASDLDPVLELIADHGYIRPHDMDERTGPGRKPSQIYDVHPAFTGSHYSHNSQNGQSAFSYTTLTSSHNSHNSQNGHKPDYSIDCIARDGREVWRLWNDTTNTVISEHGSEQEAQTAATRAP